MQDIVFPEGNEQDFLDMAKLLGYDTLYFCYPDRRDVPEGAKPARLFDMKTASKAGNVLSVAYALENTRHYLEKTRVHVIFGMEGSYRPDFMHHRNSGLNHVLASIAHERGKTIGFSFSEILRSKKRHILLGRMMQNIRLCRKYKVKTFIGSFARDPYDMRSPHDLKAFFRELGMDTAQLRDSFSI